MRKSSTPRPPISEVLSRSEVAETFGVSPSTITRWAREGKLPCIVTLGGQRRYLRDDVAKLVAAARRAAMPLSAASGTVGTSLPPAGDARDD
jgi:excisionase family DNA binding protein